MVLLRGYSGQGDCGIGGLNIEAITPELLPLKRNTTYERDVSLLAEVLLNVGESLESALKRFKRKVMAEDIIKDIKRHAFYLKPGQKMRVNAAQPGSKVAKVGRGILNRTPVGNKLAWRSGCPRNLKPTDVYCGIVQPCRRSPDAKPGNDRAILADDRPCAVLCRSYFAGSSGPL